MNTKEQAIDNTLHKMELACKGAACLIAAASVLAGMLAPYFQF
jgi:hypothetical protein